MMNNEEGTSLCDVKYKIVFLGDMSVGKSSIIERFIKGFFDDKIQHTVGIDFLAKNIIYQKRMYRLQLWDTAGQQKFRSLIPAYLRDAHCAVFVYDIGNEKSFQNVDHWVQLFEQYKLEDAVMILAANKTDLKERRVGLDGLKYAREKGMHYYEVSAKKGDGIEVMFESIIQNIHNKDESTGIGTEPTTNETNSNQSKSKNKKPSLVINFQKKKIGCCRI